MKTLRMFGMLAVATFLGAGLASCSDDNDVTPNNGNNTSVVVQPDQNEQGSLMGNGLKFIITSFTEPRSCQVVGTTSEIDKDSFTGGIEVPAYINYNGAKYAVTSIGKSAFYGFSKMTAVSLPSTLEKIEEGAFYYCSSLESVAIPKSVTSIGSSAFSGCTSLTSVDIPNNVTSIARDAFYRCSSLTSVTIPSSVTTIYDGAFSGCTGLTSVTIPNSVTTIGDWAFSDCTSLTTVEIPNSVTTIGYGAFWGCTSLTTVEIPNSVTTIGDWAFRYCTSLTTAEIPNSVTTIGEYAFGGCTGLTSVIVKAETPPSCYYYDYYSPFDSYSTTLYVPTSSVAAYKSAWPWSNFKTILGGAENM